MKRLVLISAMLIAVFAMTTNVQAQSSDQTEINMSLTVDEYIEAVPTIDWDLGETYQSDGGERLYTTSPVWDFAYANCPFNVTIEGDNPAGDGVPRFAREEEGANANGFDRLRSLYRVYIHSNDVQYPDYQAMMHAGEFPVVREIEEAPHDGQVGMHLELDVNGNTSTSPIPLRKTAIDPNFSWEESADAGVYEAELKVTLSAL